MATRSLIARKTTTGWEAVYHHWDGYPQGLGAALFDLYRGHFERNSQSMVDFLLSHRAGWSNIIGRDFNKEVGFACDGPNCYCHGERSEGPYPYITDEDSDFAGAQFCYVINTADDTMLVLKRYYGSAWRVHGSVDLEGVEPEWDSLAAS